MVYQKEVRNRIIANIEAIVPLINSLMDSLFIQFYNLPIGIRMICKLIEVEAKLKFGDKMGSNDIIPMISDFIFGCYILPSFKFNELFS
jgi:hypothetical protein